MAWCQGLFFQYGWLLELLSLSVIPVQVKRLKTKRMLQLKMIKSILPYFSLKFLLVLFQSPRFSVPDDRPVIPSDRVHSDPTLGDMLFVTEPAVRIHQTPTSSTPTPLGEKERQQPYPPTPRTCLEHTRSTLPLAKSQLTAYTEEAKTKCGHSHTQQEGRPGGHNQ